MIELKLASGRPPTVRRTNPRATRWRRLAEKQINAYLVGRATAFSTPYDLGSLPLFTRSVLEFVARIPYGETRSYRWLAERLGRPRSARAVGNALARNRLPIIIPCHHVVRCDGAIGPFALGSGWKKRLLRLEKRFVKTKTLRK